MCMYIYILYTRAGMLKMVMGHKTDGLILQMTDFVGPLVPRCCMTLRYWNSNGRRPSRCDPKTGTAATRASDTDWEILYMRFTFLYLIEFAASSASSFLVGLPLLSEACYFFFHHLFSHLWFSSFGSCCSQGWVGGWVGGWGGVITFYFQATLLVYHATTVAKGNRTLFFLGQCLVNELWHFGEKGRTPQWFLQDGLSFTPVTFTSLGSWS